MAIRATIKTEPPSVYTEPPSVKAVSGRTPSPQTQVPKTSMMSRGLSLSAAKSCVKWTRFFPITTYEAPMLPGIQSAMVCAKRQARGNVPLGSVGRRIRHIPPGQKSNKRSTTIIELVAAIVVLSVALPPLISAFAEAAVDTIRPSYSTVASFLATERMEEIIARRYRATDGYNAVTVANYPSEAPVTNFLGFNRVVTVTFVDAALNTVGSDQGYKKVRVTVSWNNAAEEIVLERVFADI